MPPSPKPPTASGRAIDLELQPEAHDEHGLRLTSYTFGYTLPHPSMRERVHLDAEVGPVRLSVLLTPAEARLLAEQLERVANQADEHRDRREQLEDIEEQLRDPDVDIRSVRYVHPDVVYCSLEDMDAVCAANPGKFVIGDLDMPATAAQAPANPDQATPL